jgi:hypothetical protein
MKLRSA